MKPRIKEYALLFLVATLLLVWTSLPNWRGHSLENESQSYVGTFFDTRDYAVHVAMIRAGMQGDWAYSFRFTTEPHQPQYIRLFYIILGQLNRLLQMEPENLFHAARWILGYAALITLYRMLKRFFASPSSVWVAFLLGVMGSGLGMVQGLFGWHSGAGVPVDLWLIDAYMLFSLSLFPHFAFTLTLMCVAVSAWMDFLAAGDLRFVGLLVGAAVLVQFVNPIAFVLVDVFFAVVTLLTWWKSSRIVWRQAWALAFIALSQIPLFLYNFLLLQNDPLWSVFTLQNKTLSPAPIYYLWGFGLFWLFGAIGLVRALRERHPAMLAAGAWIISAFVLAYAPLAIQRRFLLGVTIPFGVLSAYALEWIAARIIQWRPSLRRYLAGPALILVAFMSLTSLLLVPAYVFFLAGHPVDYFYPHSLDEAFTWISDNSQPDDFFLGAESSGRLIAQKTGRQVVLGHPMETLDYTLKVERVKAYYSGAGSADGISAPPVRWVIFGPYEQDLSPNFKPGPNLQLMFANEAVKIFRIKQ